MEKCVPGTWWANLIWTVGSHSAGWPASATRLASPSGWCTPTLELRSECTLTGLPFRVVHSNTGTQVRVYVDWPPLQGGALQHGHSGKTVHCKAHCGDIFPGGMHTAEIDWLCDAHRRDCLRGVTLCVLDSYDAQPRVWFSGMIHTMETDLAV